MDKDDGQHSSLGALQALWGAKVDKTPMIQPGAFDSPGSIRVMTIENDRCQGIEKGFAIVKVRR